MKRFCFAVAAIVALAVASEAQACGGRQLAFSSGGCSQAYYAPTAYYAPPQAFFFEQRVPQQFFFQARAPQAAFQFQAAPGDRVRFRQGPLGGTRLRIN